MAWDEPFVKSEAAYILISYLMYKVLFLMVRERFHSFFLRCKEAGWIRITIFDTKYEWASYGSGTMDSFFCYD